MSRSRQSGGSQPAKKLGGARRSRVVRVGAREGYDRWAESYDETANPVVAMDERVTPGILRPAPGELVLDAACGTGRHLAKLIEEGARAVGTDFSPGMLRVARRRAPGAPLVLADLRVALPFSDAAFHHGICALVGEHLPTLARPFAELARVLRPGGTLVFSVYHPAMAEAGYEANFESEGVEYRLGAHRHGLEDYARSLRSAGFRHVRRREYVGDEELAREIPSARKFVDFPLLVVFVAEAGPQLPV